jgi:ABC-type Fe3+-siderophore transport system permease subunit
MFNPEAIPQAGMLTGIIISLGFFTMIVLSIYFYTRARNRERIAMIEKGADLSKFYNKPNEHQLFKNGLFLMGIALGLFMGFSLTKIFLTIDDKVAYISMILLFGGLSKILYYPISAKYLKKDVDGS